MSVSFLIFYFIVLIFSVIVHEISHGYIAERLGDPTARLAGRLTLNPISHIDLFGSIILPLLLLLPSIFGASPGIIVGWAKPVPYNPFNLKNPVKGAALIAAAGPLSNLIIAAIFGVFIRLLNSSYGFHSMLVDFFSVIVYLNIVLAIFNLLPIPPIDGSKVVNFLLPPKLQIRYENFWRRIGNFISRNFFLFIIVIILSLDFITSLLFRIIGPIVRMLYVFFTGTIP